MIEIYHSLSDEQADLYHLILSADGMQHHVLRTPQGWSLQVEPDDRLRAEHLIAAYLDEATAAEEEMQVTSLPPPSRVSAAVAAVLLLICHVLVLNSVQPSEIIRNYGASARYILIGEQYRTVTALMLHADWLHIGSNIVGLALFGASVAGIAGAGVGWLMIMGCGALGNYANAWIRQSGHISIGASTAVFAALGLLVGWQAVRYYNTRSNPASFWIPLCGGLALLAMLGSGANTDVMAHATGFAAGLITGVIYNLTITTTPPWRIQRNCLLILGLIIVLAWFRLF